ncbi:MAG: hypothetical protein ACOC5L_02880 [Halobacteriota archaeon]
MKCSTCGKELKDEDYDSVWVNCTFCKSPICEDCVHYIGVKKEDVYKEYTETLPVCKDCTPKTKVRKKLADIVDEVLGK